MNAILSRNERAEAIRIAKAIGRRVSEPDSTRQAFAAWQHVSEAVAPWDPLPLGSGCTAPALLLAALDRVFPGEGWDRAMHCNFAAAAYSTSGALGMMNGWAGLLVALEYAAVEKSRYSHLRSRLRRSLASAAAQTYAPPFREPASFNEFDLCSGAAGIVIALSYMQPSAGTMPAAEYLYWLVTGTDASRWGVQLPADTERGEPAPRYNVFGTAHGIAGVLSAICSTEPSASRDAAIRRICNELERAAGGAAHPAWPAAVSSEDARPPVTTWCYGTLGIAASLAKAAVAVSDTSYLELGTRALHGLRGAGRDTWNLKDSCLCHGLAGAVLVFHEFARLADDRSFAALAAELTGELIRRFRSDDAFGYTFDDAAGARYDSGAFLIGASGVAITLLTVAADTDDSWTVLMGL